MADIIKKDESVLTDSERGTTFGWFSVTFAMYPTLPDVRIRDGARYDCRKSFGGIAANAVTAPCWSDGSSASVTHTSDIDTALVPAPLQLILNKPLPHVA